MKKLLINIMSFILLILGFIPTLLGAIFLSVMMLGHPFLVGEIVSQVETPFLIRIGQVMMTYPILFAALWFGGKLLDGDKKKALEEEESDSVWPSIVMIILLLPFLISYGFASWKELQLRHQLWQEGVEGVAIVQECDKKEGTRKETSCYMSYQYKVLLADKTTKLYNVRYEHVSCARVCNIGSSVDMTYLPQTPSKAGIEGNTYGLERRVFWFTFWFNILLLPLSTFLDLIKKWFGFFLRLAKRFTGSPNTKEVEIRQSPSLKDKPFKLDKQEIIIEALRANPQDARAWLILGWMMAKEGKSERASECYQRALKINLRSHEAGELSAGTLPTWLDLVAAEEEVALISNDLYPSQDNGLFPNWLDEEENRSLFSRLRPLLLSPLILFFSLMIILPFGSILSKLFFGEAPLTRFLDDSFVIIISVLPVMTILYTLKLFQLSRDSRHWPTSSAIVIGSFARTWLSKGKRHYNLHVVCAYQVDHHIFYSTVPSENFVLISSAYQHGGDQSEHSLQQKEKKFSFPRRMRVFYKPRQPHIVLHQVGFNPDVIELIIAMMVFALLSGVASYAVWQAFLRELAQ